MNTQKNNHERQQLLSRGERESMENGDFRYIVATSEETRKRAISALVPALFFLFLMGSISFLLIRNFDYLYPSSRGGTDHSRARYSSNSRINTGTHSRTNTRGGATSGATDNATDNNYPAIATSTNTGTIVTEEEYNQKNTNSESHDDTSADCANHSQCDLLGLTGQCCPTADGVTLSCC